MLGVVVSTVVKWALHLLASVGLLGLAWCSGHHQGVVAQKAKDAPVIVGAKADAATGQAQSALTTSVLQDATNRADYERTITEKAQYVSQAVNAAVDAHTLIPADVDARWRAGIVSLRDGGPYDSPDGTLGGLHGGPSPEGAGLAAPTPAPPH